MMKNTMKKYLTIKIILGFIQIIIIYIYVLFFL